jgi:protein-disulfide isomerase/uncharacterized membrane protein
MVIASVMTIQHYFAANYPTSIYEGSFCDINSFFNCDSSAFSMISEIAGVPLGYGGVIIGVLVCLGAIFPSAAFEKTNQALSTLNIIGVISLFLFSVFYLGSLCLLCAGYYVSSLVSFLLFLRYGTGRNGVAWFSSFFQPSFKYLATIAVFALAGAYCMALYHDARREAQSGGVAARIVKQYFSLPQVELPSIVSPYWSVRSTESFEEAPIQVIEYADFLCSDCLFLFNQLKDLKNEFDGKINIAFQFFPLEADCNQVVEKDKHPGACELSYIAAAEPDRFAEIHDEIFSNFESAKDPQWREDLASRYGVSSSDIESVKPLVHSILETGKEYEKTSEQYAFGIRSTPTLIINGRMIIGTLPQEQLRAIFQALLDEDAGNRRFLENWE